MLLQTCRAQEYVVYHKCCFFVIDFVDSKHNNFQWKIKKEFNSCSIKLF